MGAFYIYKSIQPTHMLKKNYAEMAMEVRRKNMGKLAIHSKIPLDSKDDLSVAFPGVFRGALDAKSHSLTEETFAAVAEAVKSFCVEHHL